MFNGSLFYWKSVCVQYFLTVIRQLHAYSFKGKEDKENYFFPFIQWGDLEWNSSVVFI